MTNFNPENERVKHKYFEWEREAKGKSEATVSNIRKHICMYEELTDFKNFKLFNKADAINVKKHLAHKQNKFSGELMSKSSQHHTIKDLNNFFTWLQLQPGYKKCIDLNQVAYLKLSEKDIQAARSSKTTRYPTIPQIEHVVKNMPYKTEVQKRDRAFVAFLAVSGCRVSAAMSLKLKHVFLDDERIDQNPHEVKTKFSKPITTFLLPNSELLKTVFVEWVYFLKNEKLYDDSKPLFPNTKLSLDKNDQFSRHELDIIPWQSTTCVRKIVKKAFHDAGLEYYNPHSFRNSIVAWGAPLCRSTADIKALSQNLGHSKIMTTLTSYGTIDQRDQGIIVKKIGTKDENRPLTIKEFMQYQEELQNKNS